MNEKDFYNQLSFALYIYQKAINYWPDHVYMMHTDGYSLKQAREDYHLSYGFLNGECGIELTFPCP